MAKARHEDRSEAAPGEIDFAQLVTLSEDVLNIDDEAVDPSFALDSSIKSVVHHLLSNFFCEEWVSHLETEGRVLLLFFCLQTC